MANYSFYDAAIYVTCDGSEAVFGELMNMLKSQGYKVTKDPRIERDYKSLSKRHRYVSRKTPAGLFECQAEWYPTGLKLECYQNVVIENKHGGQYDFNKVSKMPFLIRMRFNHFRNIVCQSLKFVGFEFKPDVPRDASPLDQFNKMWTPERFKRDADGWPAASELKNWRQQTADGVPIHQGMRAYSIGWNRRWVTGRIYGGINGMWMMYDSKNRIVENHNGSHYYANPTNVRKGRVANPARDQKILEEKLEKAFKAKDYNTTLRLLAATIKKLEVKQ